MKGLKAKRQERGLTQAELGKAVGTTFKTIYNYESGNRQPDLDMLKKLAEFFCCPIDELLK